MKCPLLAHKTYIPDDWPMQVYEDCLQGECAWWDKDLEHCCIKGIEVGLAYVNQNIARIKNLMPKDLAPRG